MMPGLVVTQVLGTCLRIEVHDESSMCLCVLKSRSGPEWRKLPGFDAERVVSKFQVPPQR